MDYYLLIWFLITKYIVLRYFLLAGTVFFFVYVVFGKRLQRYRLQPNYPKISDYKRDVLYSLLTIILFSTIATLVLFVLRPYTLMYSAIHDYGWGYYALSFVLMFLLHDTYFYWMHRLMHHPKLYRHVHLIHHKSTNPSPLTSYAFHPLEALIEAGIIVIIVFVMPVHLSAIAAFMLFQFLYNIYGHLGIELLPRRFRRTGIGRLLNTSALHNDHHRYVHGNYGLYLSVWDRLMGTLRKESEQELLRETPKSSVAVVDDLPANGMVAEE